ncbi:hypothetical protein F5Y06DRAFT_307754 [Hypoxylon sp. FL0890]|nr:hypothetical protein F5Y06DRAFT_307754 [Hypoxylon sp. FL0890]
MDYQPENPLNYPQEAMVQYPTQYSVGAVPSQWIDASQTMDYQPENPAMVQYPTESSANLPADTSSFLETADPSGSRSNLDQGTAVPEDAAPSSLAAEYSETQQKGKKRVIEVKVTKRHHLTADDEYMFKDRRGNTRSTRKRSWKEEQYNAQPIMVFEGDSAIYICLKSKFPK